MVAYSYPPVSIFTLENSMPRLGLWNCLLTSVCNPTTSSLKRAVCCDAADSGNLTSETVQGAALTFHFSSFTNVGSFGRQ